MVCVMDWRLAELVGWIWEVREPNEAKDQIRNLSMSKQTFPPARPCGREQGRKIFLKWSGSTCALMSSFILPCSTAGDWQTLFVGWCRAPVHGGGQTFGYEGQQGEAKPESSETVNFVNWQAKGDGSDMKDGSLRVSNVKRGKQKPSEHWGPWDTQI